VSSAIREGIEGLSRRSSLPATPPPPPGRGRGGFVDLVIVVGLLAAMVTRTPLGGLVAYGAQWISGDDADVPSLTAYFSNGMIGAELSAVEVVLPEAPPPGGTGALPEPWRTAVRTSLSLGMPQALSAQLREAGRPVDATRALEALDAMWTEYGDAQVVVEIAALGAYQRARAIGRAVAANDANAAQYSGYRRYLPGPIARRADRFVGNTVALATALDLQWPLQADHRLVSEFGMRMHPVLKREKHHNGVDLAVPIGTPVHAAQAGEVVVVGESGASGRYVVVDHGYGVRTAYLHLEQAEVEVGTIVEQGHVIAQSGNTGRSTGAHLHFTVRIGGRATDPLRFHPIERAVE